MPKNGSKTFDNEVTLIAGKDDDGTVRVLKTDDEGGLASGASSQLPDDLGVQTSANSLSITPASDAEFALEDMTNSLPLESSSFLPVMNAPQKTFRSGFDKAMASGPDPVFFTAVATGSGMAVSQASGSLSITTGTTTYAETILRSVSSFKGSLTLRSSEILSQRIVNQEFYTELVDIIGDNLVMVINGTTSVTVTIPSNPFTSANVGQSMYMGAMSVASCPRGRYAIASVSGNDVTFTVASFPATGTGTCSLFGWNYHHLLFSGTTATLVNYDAARNGWAGGETSATINTTASPGTVATLCVRDATACLMDQLSASSTSLETTIRASRVRNVPEDNTALFIQIRAVNGSVAPASTTTRTIGFIEVENFVSQQIMLTGVAPMGLNAALPVTVAAGTLPNVTTVATVTAVTTLSNGQTAHSSAVTGSPLRIGGKVKTAIDTTLVAGDASDIVTSNDGAVVVKSYAVPDLDWFYAPPTGGIVNSTTAVTIKAAVASARNYLTALQISSDALGAATEIAIRDGAGGTVLWRTKVSMSGLVGGLNVTFPSPLKSTANTLLEVVTLTASITGGVFVNAQGYVAI